MENNGKRCRICYHWNKQIINIFDEAGIDLNIAQIISKHFWFKVVENDGLSNVICTECWWSIHNFHRFYNNIEYVHTNYDQITSKTNSSLNDNILDNSLQHDNHYIDKMHLIKLEDPFDGAAMDEQNDNNNKSSDTVLWGRASTTLTSSNTNNDEDEDEEIVIKPDIIETLSENEITNDDTAKVTNETVTIENMQTFVKNAIKRATTTYNNSTKSDSPNGKKNKKQYKNKSSPVIDTNLQMQREDAQIREYFEMDCELCNVKLQTFTDVRNHYRNEHNIPGYIRCCDRKFFQRGHILIHVKIHINPEEYKCKYCSKVFKKKSTLKYHTATHDNTLERPFKCESCTKTFLESFDLTRHRNLHHANACICDICNKSYKSRFHVTQHIKKVHISQRTHMCDICAKVFKSYQILKFHRTSHFETEEKPKVQCNICGIWLKYNEKYLRKHIRRHADFARKCTLCGKEVPNRESLLRHMRQTHSDPKFLCSICNKSFKHAVTLKEHMASHTGETLYTCTHCPKTFNSNANMYSHRKKIHPIEWEQMRAKRYIP